MEININSTRHGKFIVLVDDDDYEKLKEYHWSIKISKSKYHSIPIAESRKNNKLIAMHRLITNCPAGMYVDHKNHNTLDNRKENLRVCTNAQNCSNVRKPKGSSSSNYKGVHFYKRSKKYQAYIKVNYKRIHLGFYENEDQAAIAYNIAALKYHGEFACLNENIMMHKGFH